MSRRPKIFLPRPDTLFLASATILLLFGFIVLTSATGVVAYTKFGNAFFYVQRQLLFGFLPGLFLFFLGYILPYTVWRRLAFSLFIFSLVLLLLVFVPGIGAAYGRARSWLSFGGFSLQPAEIVKFALLCMLARVLEERRSIIAVIAVLSVIGVLLLAQPDIGTFGLIVAMTFVVYVVAGAPWWHLGIFIALGATVVGVAIAWAPYRLARIFTFLSPERDPTGAGYQLVQSLLAIGSGGIFGVGLGASRQKLQYLPEVAADSIFSIMAEELGFFIMVIYLCLFLLLTYRALRIAEHAPDQFARLFTVGVCSWFFFQAFFNIASMIGVLPLTGLPLPFVSYGGSAMAMILFALGIVANISRYSHKT